MECGQCVIVLGFRPEQAWLSEARIEKELPRLPKKTQAEVEQSGIVVVVLLKTRRGTSRMASDVIFPIR